MCWWCFRFNSVSLTVFGRRHGVPLPPCCVWQVSLRMAQRTEREGFVDHRAGWGFLSSLKTSRIPLLKHSLVKTTQLAAPWKEKTSALWNHGSCVFILVINWFQILEVAESVGTAVCLCFPLGLKLCATGVQGSVFSWKGLLISTHMALSARACCSCFNFLSEGFVCLTLRCRESPADTQPAQYHDLPKKQLCSQQHSHLCRPVPLSTVPALRSQLRSAGGCRGRWCHSLTLDRQHSEGSKVNTAHVLQYQM